ncbi:MAG: hypothetical protein SPH68_03425 [Candidatus Borkfalkiaceae bacterium]|nr:hypothetical protein [Clostridia bacterium]MDY6223196.1 hypothetical protein [Christensenellaceae bacterium]
MNDIRTEKFEQKPEKNEYEETSKALQEEAKRLHYLAKIEDLAEKKSKIYSRLLIDAALAQDMEQLAVEHAQAKKNLLELAKKQEA